MESALNVIWGDVKPNINNCEKQTKTFKCYFNSIDFITLIQTKHVILYFYFANIVLYDLTHYLRF